jgi:hypothetical protein
MGFREFFNIGVKSHTDDQKQGDHAKSREKRRGL